MAHDLASLDPAPPPPTGVPAPSVALCSAFGRLAAHRARWRARWALLASALAMAAAPALSLLAAHLHRDRALRPVSLVTAVGLCALAGVAAAAPGWQRLDRKSVV